MKAPNWGSINTEIANGFKLDMELKDTTIDYWIPNGGEPTQMRS